MYNIILWIILQYLASASMTIYYVYMNSLTPLSKKINIRSQNDSHRHILCYFQNDSFQIKKSNINKIQVYLLCLSMLLIWHEEHMFGCLCVSVCVWARAYAINFGNLPLLLKNRSSSQNCWWQIWFGCCCCCCFYYSILNWVGYIWLCGCLKINHTENVIQSMLREKKWWTA